MEMKTLTINGQKFRMIDDGAVRYDEDMDMTPEQQSQALKNIGATTASDEKYFDIDYDGVISLKPEYRADGSQNAELPEVLVIPDVVNDIAVSALSESMFENNHRVKSVTIPNCVTVIPKYFANKAVCLTELNGTENVEVIGQAAFQMCGIKKAMFPSLKVFEGAGHFNVAPSLAIVDIGNTVTTISQNCFASCDRLSLVRGGENVTDIKQKGFWGTRSLKNLPIVANVKSMGNNAFELSRVNFDWWTFKTTSGCTFGTNATPAHLNPSAWWADCDYTACENPLGSTFHQRNPEWASEYLPNSSDTYGTGCLETSTAHIYSALTGVNFNSPRYFVETIVGGIDNGRLLTPTGEENGEPAYNGNDMCAWLTALGLQCEILEGGYNSENMQKIYDALADGALIQTYINPGHAGVIYGVAANGEVLVLDSDGSNRAINDYTSRTFQQPISSLVCAGHTAMIVKKPTEV